MASADSLPPRECALCRANLQLCETPTESVDPFVTASIGDGYRKKNSSPGGTHKQLLNSTRRVTSFRRISMGIETESKFRPPAARVEESRLGPGSGGYDRPARRERFGVYLL